MKFTPAPFCSGANSRSSSQVTGRPSLSKLKRPAYARIKRGPIFLCKQNLRQKTAVDRHARARDEVCFVTREECREVRDV